MSTRSRHDIVVAGAGPAGASAACLLARAGRSVLLVERDAGPRHKICGEFLSIEAQACLARLGIDVRGLGGVPVRVLRIVHGQDIAEVHLPFTGIGLSRRSMDEALLRKAVECGASLVRGASARAVEADGRDLRIRTGCVGEIRAGTLFLATGKHDVRGAKRPAVEASDDVIGFKTYYVVSPAERAALDNCVEIVLFAGGYAGLQFVDREMTNLCLLVKRDLFQHIGQKWDALLAYLCETCPHLNQRLSGAMPLLERPLSIARIPYGFVHRPDPTHPDGLFRLGDQVGVIPPFSGDGISIALHSGQLAAATYLARGNASLDFHRKVRRDIEGQIHLASVLDRACRSSRAQRALVKASQGWPSVMRLIAERTRVPKAALRRAELAPAMVGELP